jgi:hypothetical protein
MNISRKARAWRDATHLAIVVARLLAGCWRFKLGRRKFTDRFACKLFC